jgi:hypothetical protein
MVPINKIYFTLFLILGLGCSKSEPKPEPLRPIRPQPPELPFNVFHVDFPSHSTAKDEAIAIAEIFRDASVNETCDVKELIDQIRSDIKLYIPEEKKIYWKQYMSDIANRLYMKYLQGKLDNYYDRSITLKEIADRIENGQ